MRGYFHSRAIVAAFVVGSLSVGVHAEEAGDEGVVLTPSSDWHVDYGDERCRLARAFGEGENRHILYLDQTAPSERFDLTVAGPAFKGFSAVGVLDLQFGETINRRGYKMMKGNLDPFGPALFFTRINVSAEEDAGENDTSFRSLDAENAKTIDFIALGRGKRKVTLATGGMSSAFDAVNACALDLIRSWGVDPDKHRTKARSVKWKSPTAIARRIQAAFPAAAANPGEGAIFKLRAIVDEAGDVVECKLYSPNGANHLDSPACTEFRKAKFEPALDADGQPMKSYYTTTLTYYTE